MKKPLINVGASVRDRLKALAVKRQESFDLVLVRYGIERLLYRLSQSPSRRDFVLKGAMLFMAWEGMQHRETRDLDLTGFGEPSPEKLIEAFKTICSVRVPDDGLVFVGVHGEPIRALDEYGGVRLKVLAKLTAARITIQVDVGFGNRITPRAREVEYPTLLDFPAPKLRAYPVETVVAEKLQAMVNLGLRNGRLKDYFDLWHLGRTVDFDGKVLAEAVRATFIQRRTPFPEGAPVGLTARFYDDPIRQTQWRAFLNKVDQEHRPASLNQVVEFLRPFLLPVLAAAEGDRALITLWKARGPWKEE